MTPPMCPYMACHVTIFGRSFQGTKCVCVCVCLWPRSYEPNSVLCVYLEITFEPRKAHGTWGEETRVARC